MPGLKFLGIKTKFLNLKTEEKTTLQEACKIHQQIPIKIYFICSLLIFQETALWYFHVI